MRSVTKIIGRVFPMDPNIPKHILETARQRGVSVHEWVEQYNEWKLHGGDKPIINLEYQLYADYYEEWFNEYEIEPIHSELKLSIPDTLDEDGNVVEHGLVGVIDMVCESKIGKILVSLKLTHSLNVPYCELQESAYNELLLRNGVIDSKIPSYVLHISKRGRDFVKLQDRWELFNELRKLDTYLLENGVK